MDVTQEVIEIFLKYLVQVKILGQLDTMVLLLPYAPTSPTVQHTIVLGPKVLEGEMRTLISRPP